MVREIIQVQGPLGFAFLDNNLLVSTTLTRDPGILVRNTLLIDCSPQRGEHSAIDIFDLCLMVR